MLCFYCKKSYKKKKIEKDQFVKEKNTSNLEIIAEILDENTIQF